MPVCKGCGGSFDDSFRFCPYCGQAKPEPDVIKVEVSVSSDDKWETCQIRRYIYKEERVYEDVEVEEGYFWADGIGPNGTFSAGESPIFDVVYVKDKKTYKWNVSRSGSTPAHDFLVNRLIKNGWEPDGSFGEKWWQNQFRRRYGKEYPPSWTIWEICRVDSGFIGKTSFYAIQSVPTGNKKEPVKHGKSREFNTGFLGLKGGDTPENMQILKEFLAELKNQGYELVSPSENESLRKCKNNQAWDFQLLMKKE